MILTLLLVGLNSWGGVAPSAPNAPPNATAAASSVAGIIGAGGRLSWEAEPRGEPSLHLDAQLVVRPTPRMLLTGAWGRSERALGGADAPESTSVETRWELGAAWVVLQSAGSGYIPVVWRSTRNRDDRLGDASWNSWGFGLGGVFPVVAPVWFRTEGLWMIEDRRDDPERGPGRTTKRSGLELGLGFLIFVR